jgi:hypothetical protein
MSGPNGMAKPSDTVTFTGVENPVQTSGALQTGGWDDNTIEVLQGVPAQTRVAVSGAGVTRVGAPNQFKLQVSLAQGSVQLQGHVSTANNVNTDPAVAPFAWFSRQKFVAIVNSSGLVTPVGQGFTTIECRYPRSANALFTNATPSGTEFAYATVDLTVTA